MTVYIDGLGTVQTNSQVEYTTAAVTVPYLADLTTLQTILTKSVPTTDDYTHLSDAIADLKKLATQGAQDPTLANTTFFLTASMADNLGLVMKSLTAVGLPDASVTDPTQQVQLIKNWQSLSSFGVANLLTTAIGSTTDATRSLQSMIELEYVKQGNDYINANLGNLENQVQTTNNILSNLTVVQNVINQITVTPKSNFVTPDQITQTSQIPSAAYAALGNDIGASFTAAVSNDATAAAALIVNNPNMSDASALNMGANTAAAALKGFATGSVDNFEAAYQAVASASFNQVFPTATPTVNAASSLIAAYNGLKSNLSSLMQQLGPSALSQNSIGSFVNSVVQDISARMVTAALTSLTPGTAAYAAAYKSAVSAYIIDNQNQKLTTSSGFQAGAIQTNVTNAISSAQSLNTQQQASVNNYEFVFQQFYTSASNVLSQLSQTIQDTAQGIAKQ